MHKHKILQAQDTFGNYASTTALIFWRLTNECK